MCCCEEEAYVRSINNNNFRKIQETTTKTNQCFIQKNKTKKHNKINQILRSTSHNKHTYVVVVCATQNQTEKGKENRRLALPATRRRRCRLLLSSPLQSSQTLHDSRAQCIAHFLTERSANVQQFFLDEQSNTTTREILRRRPPLELNKKRRKNKNRATCRRVFPIFRA